MKSANRLGAWAGMLVLALGVFLFSPDHASAQGGVDPGPTPGFTGVSLAVANSQVPPGGLFQYQLMLTEPKPIGNSSSRPTLFSSTLCTVGGIALSDPIGQTAGVAVINSAGIQINATSPGATFGTSPNIDYPIISIAMPVRSDAPVGTQVPLGLDLANSFWLDPFGQPYAQEIKPGKLTVGGTLNISDVVPGGGFQPAGAKISIFGMGFTHLTQVGIQELTLTPDNYQVVSSNQIDVILPQGVSMDGARVRLKTETGEDAKYFSYLRTQSLGQSANPLVNQSYPLFSRTLYTSATLAWTRDASRFTALAVQNPGAVSANITVAMLSANNDVLGSFSFPLPPLSRATRDLVDFFGQPPAGAVQVRVSSTQQVQMLGLLGDQALGVVAPVIVSVP